MDSFQRWKKPCLAGLLLCCSWYAHAADWCTQPELNLNGLSKHFDDANRSPADKRNEVNTGLGLTCRLKGIGGWRDELEGGFYKNSHFKNSFYVAYGLYYPVNSVVFVGLRNAIITGYPSGSSGSGIVLGPLPSMKIELSHTVTLNLSVTPKRNAVVFANLGFKF